MNKIDIEELLKKANSYKNNGIAWHHHFFTPKYKFNDSNKYQIILECEDDGKSYFSEFNEKPINELKILEKLFFNDKN